MDRQYFFFFFFVILTTCRKMFNTNKPWAIFIGSRIFQRPFRLLGEGERDLDEEKKKREKPCMCCLLVLAGRLPLRRYCKAIISGGVRDL